MILPENCSSIPSESVVRLRLLANIYMVKCHGGLYWSARKIRIVTVARLSSVVALFHIFIAYFFKVPY